MGSSGSVSIYRHGAVVRTLFANPLSTAWTMVPARMLALCRNGKIFR